MALQHRLSDALKLDLEQDLKLNRPVVSIEFKFVHYRLVIDDEDNTKKLIELIKLASVPKGPITDKQPLPKFYSTGGKNRL